MTYYVCETCQRDGNLPLEWHMDWNQAGDHLAKVHSGPFNPRKEFPDLWVYPDGTILREITSPTPATVGVPFESAEIQQRQEIMLHTIAVTQMAQAASGNQPYQPEKLLATGTVLGRTQMEAVLVFGAQNVDKVLAKDVVADLLMVSIRQGV